MKKIMLLVMLVLSILIVACNPSPQENANSDSETQKETEEQKEYAQKEETLKDTEKEADEKPKEEPKSESKSETKTSDNKADELKDLFLKQRSLNFKVDYELTADAAGTTMTSDMTQYIKGIDKLRTDATAQGIETRTYIVDEVLTSCNKATGNWMCNTLKSQPQDESSEVLDEIEEKPENFDVTKIASKTVAGTTTDCYRINTDEGYTVDYCFSKEGVPLYVKMQGPGITSEQIATSYKVGGVTDGDFKPPATTQEIEIPSGIPSDILANLPS